jgi:hypothetical protein
MRAGFGAKETAMSDQERHQPDGTGGRVHPDGRPSADDDDSVGQVLGSDVVVPTEQTRAEPGSPETGARRDASGRPTSG